MKKLLTLLLVFALIISANISVAATTIPIYLDDVKLPLTSPPVIINGVTIVPVADILRPLGADIKWDSVTKTVTATKGDTEIILKIGETSASVNGKSVSLAAKAQIINGKTMIPLKFVSETLGYNVAWDGTTRTIYIDSRIPQNSKYLYPGMFKVGVDIEPGLYKMIAGEYAYVEATKDSSGEFDSINWNNSYENIGYFEVFESDAYIKVNHGKFFKFNLENAQVNFQSSYSDGIYLIGIDIAPGEYKIDVGDDSYGYVLRSSDVNGSFDNIIMNDIYSGPSYVTIDASDFSITINSCTLTPVK